MKLSFGQSNAVSVFDLESNDELKFMFENNLDGAIVVDIQGRILRANTAAVEILEYSHDELLTMFWKQLISGVTLYSLNKESEFKEKRIYKGHLELIKRSGSLFLGEASIYTFKTQHDEPHYHIILREAAEKIHLKKLLHEKEKSYISLINNIGEGIYHTAENGQFLTVNPSLIKMLGYETREEFMDLNIQTDIFVNPYDRMLLKDKIREESHAKLGPVQWRKKNGSVFEVNLFERASKDDKGEIKYYEGFVEDLSEKSNLKNQLMHVQRLELMGSLVGEVAHDFNNMLTVISGNVALIQERKPSSEIIDSLLQIANTCKRAAKLTKRILSFTRNQVKQMQNISINIVGESVIKMLESILNDSIRLETEFDSQVANTYIEPSQIEQVIMNVCLNACDAMPSGGILNLTTKNIFIDQLYAQEHPWAVQGNYVLLAVHDTGKGMSDEVKNKVFEPFFTTKPAGKGTGLGLSMAYNVIKEHRGYIDIESAPSKGTTVNIYFPTTTNDILITN